MTGGGTSSRSDAEGDRLVVFADRSIGFAPALAAAALASAERMQGVRPVALVDAARFSPPRFEPARRLAAVLLERLTGPHPGKPRRRLRPPATLARAARRHAIPLLVPPARDVNRPELLAELCGRLGANLALSVGCRQIFGSALLAAFEVAANFHDGLLPAYRGLAATSWSLYREEAESGFTVHRMEVGIDSGPVLFEEALPVVPGTSASQMLRRKIARATGCMDEILAALVRRDPGRPQAAGGTYQGAREQRQITTIPDPSSLPWSELRRRLDAFGTLHLDLGGRSWEVTALRLVPPSGRRPGRLAFTTLDGLLVEPWRFRHLPRPLDALVELFGRGRADRTPRR